MKASAASRAALIIILVITWFAPVAQATSTCTSTDTGYECSIDATEYGNGPVFTIKLTQEATLQAITFTSLTCDDWESDEGTGAYAADPILKLYDDAGTLIMEADDNASHVDNIVYCWDAEINVTLQAGTYELLADSYSAETTGVYSMDINTVASVVVPVEPTPEPVEPTPEPVEPTPEPVEPTPEPVEPTPEPVEPTPEPVEPTPEPVEPTPEPTPIDDVPIPQPIPTQPPVQLLPDPTPAPISSPFPNDFVLPDLLAPAVSDVAIPELLTEELVTDGQILDSLDTDADDALNELLEDTDNNSTTDQQLNLEESLDNTLDDNVTDDYDIEILTVEQVEDLGVFEDIDESLADIEYRQLTELEQEEIIEKVEEIIEQQIETANTNQVEAFVSNNVEIINELDTATKENIEETINVFTMPDLKDYVPADSKITVEERRVVVAVVAASAAIAPVRASVSKTRTRIKT